MPVVENGGLGQQLVGVRLTIINKQLLVNKMIGEGGFSFVYLVKEDAEGDGQQPVGPRRNSGSTKTAPDGSPLFVLKVTAIHSKAQKLIAENEAKLLARCTHPCIIKMYGACFTTLSQFTGSSGRRGKDSGSSGSKEKPQHFILMEFCEGGHALEVCQRLMSQGKRFDRTEIIVAFGQICNAVSYLHSQDPPIVHRDLKPANFLVTNGTYKLCDFGSAIIGHVDLRTPKDRAYADDHIQKTTTQMFRSPEMVDLYMAKKLTQATDVWALGCCLYQMAYFQNCFEEGSNLAILSGKYTIPEDDPYGSDFAELINRMLVMDYKTRADMREVILCLSALYAGRPLPARQRVSKSSRSGDGSGGQSEDGGKDRKKERVGAFRTDGQGVQESLYDPTKKTEAKKLNSNSVAARRKRAAQQNSKPPHAPTSSTARTSTATANSTTSSDPMGFGSFHSDFSNNEKSSETAQKDGFGSSAFGEMKGFGTKGDTDTSGFFSAFDNMGSPNATSDNAFDAAFDTGAWGDSVGQQQPGAAQSKPPEPQKVELTGEQRALAILRQGQNQQQGDVDSQPASSAAHPNGGHQSRAESNDSERKDRSRKSRPHGQHNGRGSVERQMENMTMAEGGGTSGVEHQVGDTFVEVVDKRSSDEHRSRRSRSDDDDKKRRSSSRSRRKARGTRDSGRAPDRQDGGAGGGGEKKHPRKAQSFRNVFNRKRAEA